MEVLALLDEGWNGALDVVACLLTALDHGSDTTTALDDGDGAPMGLFGGRRMGHKGSKLHDP
jgi:hypothetical protein